MSPTHVVARRPSAQSAEDSEALAREHVELSADCVAVQRGQVLEAADLPADAVAVGETGVTGAIAAEVAAEPVVVRRRVEVAFGRHVIDLSRLIREAFGEAGYPSPMPAYAVSGMLAGPPLAH